MMMNFLLLERYLLKLGDTVSTIAIQRQLCERSPNEEEEEKEGIEADNTRPEEV